MELKHVLDELNTATADTPQAKEDILQETGQTPPTTEQAPKGSDETPTEPETLTKEEHKRLTDLALMKQGREHKKALDVVIRDKETATKLADKNARELEAIQVERDELNARIDEMSDGDPLSPANVKLLRDLKAREQVLKDKESAHEEEWASKQEVLKRVVAQEVAEVAFEVAEAYEPINGKHPAETLKSYALKRGLTTKEDIQELADTFLTKKPETLKEPEDELVLPRIVGGGVGTRMPTNEEQFRIWIAKMSTTEYERLKPEIDKALAEGKIK